MYAGAFWSKTGRGGVDNLHLTVSGKEFVVKRFSCALFDVIKVTQNKLNFLLAIKELQMFNSPAKCEFLSVSKCLLSCYLILNNTVIFWRIMYIELVSFLKVNCK